MAHMTHQTTTVAINFFSKTEVETIERVFRFYLADMNTVGEESNEIYELYGRFVDARHQFDEEHGRGVLM